MIHSSEQYTYKQADIIYGVTKPYLHTGNCE